MGRMKEVCIQIMNANDGIPEGMTIEDVVRMKELENSRETGKVKKVFKKFSSVNGKTREKKKNKQ